MFYKQEKEIMENEINVMKEELDKLKFELENSNHRVSFIIFKFKVGN